MSSSRLGRLESHMCNGLVQDTKRTISLECDGGEQQEGYSTCLVREQCSGPVGVGSAAVGAGKAHRQLPRFDSVIMEHYLSDMTGLRDDVYGMFRQHPELLVAEEEGLTKEEHRELVRRCLWTMLDEGYSPLSFFTRDFKKYFYLAELLSLVDLSLVRCLLVC